MRVASGDDAHLLSLIFSQFAQCKTDDEPAREVIKSCQCDEGRCEVGTLATARIKKEAVDRVLVLLGIIHVQVIEVVRAQVAHNCLRFQVVGASSGGNAGTQIVNIVVRSDSLWQFRQR